MNSYQCRDAISGVEHEPHLWLQANVDSGGNPLPRIERHCAGYVTPKAVVYTYDRDEALRAFVETLGALVNTLVRDAMDDRNGK